jgi:hypothetical protein
MTATQTATVSRVGNLILARLLTAGKRSPSPKKLKDDLARFFKFPPSEEQWQRYFQELEQAGMLELRPYRLTDAGRETGLEFLGLRELPPRTNWNTLRNRYLLPKALGLPDSSQETLKRISRKPNLEAVLLAARYELPPGAASTLKNAVEALACKELGYPGETSVDAVKARVLCKLLGTSERLPMKEIQKQLPRVAVGARNSKPDALRDALLQRWADPIGTSQPAPASAIQTEPEPEPETEAVERLDLPAFARTVQAAARTSPTGKFGENKVFINHVWRHLQHEPGLPHLNLTAFKSALTEANHAGLLQLSRADLVQVMDQADVQESETPYLDAKFHFVLLEKDNP